MYDKHPFLPIGTAEECLVGWPQIAGTLASLMAAQMTSSASPKGNPISALPSRELVVPALFTVDSRRTHDPA